MIVSCVCGSCLLLLWGFSFSGVFLKFSCSGLCVILFGLAGLWFLRVFEGGTFVGAALFCVFIYLYCFVCYLFVCFCFRYLVSVFPMLISSGAFVLELGVFPMLLVTSIWLCCNVLYISFVSGVFELDSIM